MANGNFAGGDGTPENPYLIEDAFDLDAVRNNLRAHYQLINDIDLNISPFNEGEGWNPIGDSNNRFIGTLDGNGNVIKNLYINRPDKNYQGLFGYGASCKLIDVAIENVDIIGMSSSGGLIGYIENSYIDGSHTTGNVVGRGLVGGLVGGVGGTGNSNIYRSYSLCNITGTSYIGGLVGRLYDSRIYECYAAGSVRGTERVGGLVGETIGSLRGSDIQNSYAANYVQGNDRVGGLIGNMSGSGIASTRRARIYKSYSTGKVIGSTNVGGLVGARTSSSYCPVEQSFWDIEASEKPNSSGGVGYTTEQMKSAQTFIDANWHIEKNENGVSIWILKDGEYPKLWYEKSNKIFFYTDEGYKIYKNNEWVTVLTNYPSIEEFREYGMKNLDRLTNKEFRKLKSDRVKIIVFKEA